MTYYLEQFAEPFRIKLQEHLRLVKTLLHSLGIQEMINMRDLENEFDNVFNRYGEIVNQLSCEDLSEKDIQDVIDRAKSSMDTVYEDVSRLSEEETYLQDHLRKAEENIKKDIEKNEDESEEQLSDIIQEVHTVLAWQSNKSEIKLHIDYVVYLSQRVAKIVRHLLLFGVECLMPFLIGFYLSDILYQYCQYLNLNFCCSRFLLGILTASLLWILYHRFFRSFLEKKYSKLHAKYTYRILFNTYRLHLILLLQRAFSLRKEELSMTHNY